MSLDAIIEKQIQTHTPIDYKVDLIMITPEIAEKLLNFNSKNRPIKDNTVKFYLTQMQSDQWIFNGEPLQFNSKGELINGQHRLKAQIIAGKTFPTVIVRNVPDDSYRTLDQQHTRSLADMLEMEQIKGATLKAAILTKFFLWSKKDGTTDVKTSLRKKNINKTEVMDEYYKRKEIYDQIHDKAVKYYQRLDLLAPSEYGGFICLLNIHKGHEIHKVYEFFDQFASYEKSIKTITKLRDKLHTAKYKRQKMTPTMLYGYVAIAWKAFITGNEPKQFFYDPEKDITPLFV